MVKLRKQQEENDPVYESKEKAIEVYIHSYVHLEEDNVALLKKVKRVCFLQPLKKTVFIKGNQEQLFFFRWHLLSYIVYKM